MNELVRCGGERCVKKRECDRERGARCVKNGESDEERGV